MQTSSLVAMVTLEGKQLCHEYNVVHTHPFCYVSVAWWIHCDCIHENDLTINFAHPVGDHATWVSNHALGKEWCSLVVDQCRYMISHASYIIMHCMYMYCSLLLLLLLFPSIHTRYEMITSKKLLGKRKREGTHNVPKKFDRNSRL